MFPAQKKTSSSRSSLGPCWGAFIRRFCASRPRLAVARLGVPDRVRGPNDGVGEPGLADAVPGAKKVLFCRSGQAGWLSGGDPPNPPCGRRGWSAKGLVDERACREADSRACVRRHKRPSSARRRKRTVRCIAGERLVFEMLPCTTKRSYTFRSLCIWPRPTNQHLSRLGDLESGFLLPVRAEGGGRDNLCEERAAAELVVEFGVVRVKGWGGTYPILRAPEQDLEALPRPNVCSSCSSGVPCCFLARRPAAVAESGRADCRRRPSNRSQRCKRATRSPQLLREPANGYPR